MLLLLQAHQLSFQLENPIVFFQYRYLHHYVSYLKNTITEDISNIKILVDTAHGAAYKTADKLFKDLNANYKIINNTPDGLNINENAGSTHIENLQKLVVENNYDIGIAYDGDADRCIIVDETGRIIDGDYIMAICGNYLKKADKLKNNTVVGTVMSNLGFVKFCEEQDINFVATKVGDKYVLEEMLKNDYSFGGEQSGHIIFKDFANPGDGELTGLQILNIMAKENKKLSELANVMQKYPQIMINVQATKEQKDKFKTDEDIKNKIESVTNILGNDGRVLIRPSGTENLIRVMIEGKNEEDITKYCQELADYISEKIN